MQQQGIQLSWDDSFKVNSLMDHEEDILYVRKQQVSEHDQLVRKGAS